MSSLDRWVMRSIVQRRLRIYQEHHSHRQQKTSKCTFTANRAVTKFYQLPLDCSFAAYRYATFYATRIRAVNQPIFHHCPPRLPCSPRLLPRASQPSLQRSAIKVGMVSFTSCIAVVLALLASFLSALTIPLDDQSLCKPSNTSLSCPKFPAT